MAKWWSECSKEEREECRLWNKKVKWLKNGYEWGLISYVDYCNIRLILELELDRIEHKYENYISPFEEQMTLF